MFLHAAMWPPACTYRRQVQKSLARRKCSIADALRRKPCTPVKTCLIFNPYKIREVKNGEASSKALLSIFGSCPPPPLPGFRDDFLRGEVVSPTRNPPNWRPGYTYLKLDVGGEGKSVWQYPRTRLQENSTGNLECSDKEGVD